EALIKMKRGTKPIEERRADRARRAAETAVAEAAAREEVEGRFAVVAERWLREHIERNRAPKYVYEVRRMLRHDILPHCGDWPIRSFTRADVNNLLDAKARRRERPLKGAQGGAAIQANRTLTRLKTLFAWAAAQDLVNADPTAGVMFRAAEVARDR